MSHSRSLVPLPEPDHAPRKNFVSSGVKVILRFIFIVVLICGIGLGLLHIRLAQSPISLSFVVPTIERAVNSALNGMHFEIGDAVLQRSSSHVLGIELRLAGVRLLDRNGDTIAESPFASGSFSIAALLSGRLAASHVELIGPKLYMYFSEENGLSLSFSAQQNSKDNLAYVPERQEKSVRGIGQPPQTWREQEIVEAGRKGLIRQARGRAVNLTKALTQLFNRSRSGETAFLTSFGIEDALVYFDRDGEISRWKVAAVDIDMSHKFGKSSISGTAEINVRNETFTLKIGAQQNRRSGQISISFGVDNILPRAFSAEFPSLDVLKMWDMPASLFADMQLGENGDILTGTIQGQLKAGNFYAPWDEKHPASIDHGDVRLTYSRKEGLIKLVNSELSWGESRIRMSGFMKRQPQTGRWAFNFSANELALGAKQYGLPVIPLDHMIAEGNYNPAQGQLTLDRFLVQAADAYIALAGQITHGPRSPAIRITGQVSAMPVAFFKLIWPKFVAYDAREWVGERMPAGHIAGGVVNVDIPEGLLADLEAGGSLPAETVDFQLDMRDLEMHYIPDLPPMNIERAIMHVAGQRFFFDAPKAEILSPSGEIMHFTDGKFIIGDLRPFIPEGEIHFKSESTAKAVLSLLDHPKLGYISQLDFPLPDISAKASSAFSLSLKLVKDFSFEHMKMNGRTQLEDVRAINLPGGFGIHGGNLKFDVTSKGLKTEGELSINGMPTLVAWQYLFKTPTQYQPPLKLRTILDQDARKELGMDIPHLLRGPVPTEITVKFKEGAQPALSFRLNLNDADITAASVNWSKPSGVPAALTFNLEPIEDGAAELRDIDLRGKDFNIQGAVRLNDDNKPVAFNLPIVSLNSQTQMRVRGELASNNVWKVYLRGSSFDGRRLFRSLLSAGKVTDVKVKLSDNSPGLDIDAEIDQVVGFFDTMLDSVKLTVSRRNNKLVALDAFGQLNGKWPFAAKLEQEEDGERKLVAQTTDAGAAFRLVGFYPSARGGEATLSVNLDDGDGTQKTGRLFARDFVIVNDQVVTEVLSRPQQAPARARNQQLLQFDRMQVPFSVGGGRFIVKNALINGPLLGATLRGSIDFANENISLTGTYVPLYGLNGALGFVPILGDLLVGRDGEGIFGITFAVKGKTSKPNVLVNPVSVVAPGFLRQIFEFNQDPLLPNVPPKTPATSGNGARSSSLPPRTQ